MKTVFLDFDWCGIIGEARYPSTLNMEITFQNVISHISQFYNHIIINPSFIECSLVWFCCSLSHVGVHELKYVSQIPGDESKMELGGGIAAGGGGGVSNM